MAAMTWDQLVNETSTGALRLDPSIARDNAAACDAYIAKLYKIQRELEKRNFRLRLGDIDGVTCGQELATEIERMIMHPETGLYGRIGQHIEVAKKMRLMYRAQFETITQVDLDNAGVIPPVR